MSAGWRAHAVLMMMNVIMRMEAGKVSRPGIAAVERTANMRYPKVRILVRELQLQIRPDPYHTVDYGPVISSQPVFVQSTLLPRLVQIW